MLRTIQRVEKRILTTSVQAWGAGAHLLPGSLLWFSKMSSRNFTWWASVSNEWLTSGDMNQSPSQLHPLGATNFCFCSLYWPCSSENMGRVRPVVVHLPKRDTWFSYYKIRFHSIQMCFEEKWRNKDSGRAFAIDPKNFSFLKFGSWVNAFTNKY